jgi:hypothetical protein
MSDDAFLRLLLNSVPAVLEDKDFQPPPNPETFVVGERGHCYRTDGWLLPGILAG